MFCSRWYVDNVCSFYKYEFNLSNDLCPFRIYLHRVVLSILVESVVVRSVPRLTFITDCNDSESECEAWALAGFCGNNPHVTEKCRKSCHTCAGVPIRSRKAQRTGRSLYQQFFQFWLFTFLRYKSPLRLCTFHKSVITCCELNWCDHIAFVDDPFCKDNNANCREWTSSDPKMCAHTQWVYY